MGLREEKKTQTREAILEAAGRLLRSTPLGELTVVAIAEEASVSVGSIYNHFTGKDEIVLEYTRSVMSRMVADSEGLVDSPDGDPRAAVRALMERYAGLWTLSDREQMRYIHALACNRLLTGGTGDFHRPVREQVARLLDRLRPRVPGGTGTIHYDLAFVIMGIYLLVFAEYLNAPDMTVHQARESLHRYVEMVLGPYLEYAGGTSGGDRTTGAPSARDGRRVQP